MRVESCIHFLRQPRKHLEYSSSGRQKREVSRLSASYCSLNLLASGLTTWPIRSTIRVYRSIGVCQSSHGKYHFLDLSPLQSWHDILDCGKPSKSDSFSFEIHMPLLKLGNEYFTFLNVARRENPFWHRVLSGGFLDCISGNSLLCFSGISFDFFLGFSIAFQIFFGLIFRNSLGFLARSIFRFIFTKRHKINLVLKYCDYSQIKKSVTHAGFFG